MWRLDSFRFEPHLILICSFAQRPKRGRASVPPASEEVDDPTPVISEQEVDEVLDILRDSDPTLEVGLEPVDGREVPPVTQNAQSNKKRQKVVKATNSTAVVVETIENDSDEEVEEEDISEDEDENIDDAVGPFSVMEKVDDNAIHQELVREDNKQKKDPIEFPPELQYSVFDEKEASPFKEKPTFDPQYRGYRRRLGQFRDMTPPQIIAYLWAPCMIHIMNCYNIRIRQENTMVKVLTIGKLKRFYGIRMYMSMFKRPAQKDFFVDKKVGALVNCLPNMTKYMSYADYLEIKANLRFEDYQACNNEMREQDKAWKVRTIFDMVKKTSMDAMPCPDEFISVDEAMIKYYGRRCPISKSMPAKPIKRGFLLYCAVDYLTKWVFNLDLSDSKYKTADFVNISYGITGQRVIDLLKHLPGSWYTVCYDNYYTSEPLAVHLRDVYKILSIGTLRKNRIPKGRPAEGFIGKTKHPKPSKNCPKGTIKACVNGTNDIGLYSMMDSGMCYFLETAYGPFLKDNMIRKEGKRDVTLQVYKAIVVYNDYMGGVDAADALRTGYYCIESQGRTSKWTVRFVEAMFNFMLAQSWVAYRFHNSDEEKYGRLDFMTAICASFLDNDDDNRVPLQTRKAVEEKEAVAFGKHHNMVDTTDLASPNSNRLLKAMCVHCKSLRPTERVYKDPRTVNMCKECEVFVHPQCMGAYHNAKLGISGTQCSQNYV